jgi:dGTPase
MAGAELPGRWQDAIELAPDDADRARIIADFIAGMTDPYAIEQYARLFDGARPLG